MSCEVSHSPDRDPRAALARVYHECFEGMSQILTEMDLSQLVGEEFPGLPAREDAPQDACADAALLAANNGDTAFAKRNLEVVIHDEHDDVDATIKALFAGHLAGISEAGNSLEGLLRVEKESLVRNPPAPGVPHRDRMLQTVVRNCEACSMSPDAWINTYASSPQRAQSLTLAHLARMSYRPDNAAVIEMYKAASDLIYDHSVQADEIVRANTTIILSSALRPDIKLQLVGRFMDAVDNVTRDLERTGCNEDNAGALNQTFTELLGVAQQATEDKSLQHTGFVSRLETSIDFLENILHNRLGNIQRARLGLYWLLMDQCQGDIAVGDIINEVDARTMNKLRIVQSHMDAPEHHSAHIAAQRDQELAILARRYAQYGEYPAASKCVGAIAEGEAKKQALQVCLRRCPPDQVNALQPHPADVQFQPELQAYFDLASAQNLEGDAAISRVYECADNLVATMDTSIANSDAEARFFMDACQLIKRHDIDGTAVNDFAAAAIASLRRKQVPYRHQAMRFLSSALMRRGAIDEAEKALQYIHQQSHGWTRFSELAALARAVDEAAK